MYAPLKKQDLVAADRIMRGYLDRFTFPQKPTESVEDARKRRIRELMANDRANAMMDHGLDALGRPMHTPTIVEKISVWVRDQIGGKLCRLVGQ